MPTAPASLPPLLISATIFLPPIILAFRFRAKTRGASEAVKKDIWFRFRALDVSVLTGTVAAWWTIWQLFPSHEFEALFFWIPPLLSLEIFLFTCFLVDRKLQSLHLSIPNLIWRAWWQLASLVLPLLMVANAFDAAMNRQVRSIAWLICAGVTAKIATGILRWGEGLKFNLARSGELRNRALDLAKAMGVSIRRVFIFPAGKGRLTNAYGMSDAVGVTDNLGKYLSKDQMKFVIAHELSHVKLKHGRNLQLFVIGTYSSLAAFLFFIPHLVLGLNLNIRPAMIIFPVLLIYWLSRIHEFAADHEAVKFTGDPKTAVRALAILHQPTELPIPDDRFAELFMTHPSFLPRIHALASCGQVSNARLTHILADQGRTASGIPVR